MDGKKITEAKEMDKSDISNKKDRQITGEDSIHNIQISKIKNEKDQTSNNILDTRNDSKILLFKNPEKREQVRLGVEEFMPMSSSRILLSGMPNVGKRNLILNLIYRMKPKPSICHLVHCDPLTIEYDILADWGIPTLIYEPENMPSKDNIIDPYEEKDEKKNDFEYNKDIFSNPLVIVDECTKDEMGSIGSHRLERLINHVCTHYNTTLICSIQSLLSIPPKARRGFNNIALWKQADNAVNIMAASRCGISLEMLMDMFQLFKSKFDFLYIDLDRGYDDPYRYRLNLCWPITINMNDS